ncbi:hypothetical protein Mgra_00007407 [Meloidogyne graminicola]|uniref:Uncharacterized protein n=1 Tax=Meloidogyne graminicola TaxID=189291 RepID=A0A8S9ZIT6_9BILA|nr:hypothetical protein Mgra_00007407 [Meloidogyne graminicola]
MFYAQFVLSKKGPLAKIWLAAHWEKKLSKTQIYETNVQDAVAEIIQPKVKLSLRTTGHLLLGIVRIYSRKAKYVLADCNEAFIKLKMTFKHGSTCDLALRDREDRMGSNDIPEVINDFYDSLPEINDFDLGPLGDFQANQSRIDDITLREERPNNYNKGLDFVANTDGEGFDDFGERDNLRRARSRSIFEEMEEEIEQQRRESQNSVGAPGESFLVPRDNSLLGEDIAPQKDKEGFELFNNNLNDFGTAEDLDLFFNASDLGRELELNHQIAATPMAPGAGDDMEEHSMDIGEMQQIPNNELSFQLEPIEQQPQQERMRHKRKRKLIIDEQKTITGEEMKANMTDFNATIQPLDLAPPTKQLMRLRENSQLEKMLIMPACAEWILDQQIIRMYQSHLELHAVDVMDITTSNELHRDLELSEAIEEEVRLEERPESAPNIEANDNLVPEPELEITPEVPTVPETLISPPPFEKKEKRRSRVEKEEEEIEEEQFTRRTRNILQAISTKIRANSENKIVFDDLLTKGSTRRTAAQKFYALLELKKWQAIEIEQGEPYGLIEISAGPRLQEIMKLPV